MMEIIIMENGKILNNMEKESKFMYIMMILMVKHNKDMMGNGLKENLMVKE